MSGAMARRNRSPRRPRFLLWVCLTGAGALSSIAAVPYARDLVRSSDEAADGAVTVAGRRLSGTQVVALAAAQGALLFGAVVAVGLRLSRRLGLPPSHLERWLDGEPATLSGRQSLESGAVGLATAVAVAAVDGGFFKRARAALAERGVTPPPPWKGLLASAYAAIGEELLLRLGAQTAAAAVIARLRHDRQNPPTPRTMYPAIGVSSLLFGVAHLPAARAVGNGAPQLLARTLVLNGLPGVVFGLLYWRRGLEASAIAHAVTATTLTVGLPLLQSRRRRP